MDERLARLDRAFNPRSIAFVGATEAAAKWGFIIFNNLIVGGYTGRLYPVNPGRDQVLGMQAYRSVRDIPGDVDLAVLTVPARNVVGAMEDCASKGVRAAVVVSAGFKELGGESALMEAELVRIADAAGIAVVGPNGQGICCPKSGLYSWMPLFYPPTGSVGVVCQSGNILNMVIGHVIDAGFGLSKAVSSGNEAQLKTEDYIEYLAHDPDTQVIAAYIEGVEDGRRFLEKARRATRSKPVVVLKGGRSESGSAAARSHTGSMAVGERMFESACRQAGVVLTRTIRETGLTAASFVNRPLPRGRRVGIVTGGGGLGVIAADACSEEGLEVVHLSKETLEEVGRLLPGWWVPGNPIDLVAGLDLTIIGPILETLIESGEVDSLLLIFVEAPRTKTPVDPNTVKGLDISAVWDAMTQLAADHISGLYDTMHEKQLPLYVVSNFTTGRGIGRKLAAGERQVMIYSDVEAACGALSSMVRYYEYLRDDGALPEGGVSSP